jgi:hypothetical protein
VRSRRFLEGRPCCFVGLAHSSEIYGQELIPNAVHAVEVPLRDRRRLHHLLKVASRVGSVDDQAAAVGP